MLRALFLFLPISLFTLSLQSQDAFYKHMEGNIGSTINVVIDLVGARDKLTGYYYYYFNDQSGDESWTHYGKSMPVYGMLKADNSFEFSEYEPDVKGAVFKGILEKGKISGTWTSADGARSLPFEATETYPLGTMAFRVIFLKDSKPLKDKTKGSPEATLELSLLVPVDYPLDNVADSVTRYIYNQFFPNDSVISDPAGLCNALRDLYFSNYRNSNTDIFEEGMAGFNWSKVKEIRIMHNEHDVLTLEYYDYGFTGGAHGLSVSRFQTIDLLDGHIFKLDEIFREDYLNDLRDIINSEARSIYGLEPGQGLTQAGFWNETIEPSENFYMTKDGIGFYYNQYEVAPYAMGPVNIFIKYQKLKRILNTESPAFRLISK